MNSDLPEEIGEAAADGDFERVKAWLAGGSDSAPRSVNDADMDDWTLLMWTTAEDVTPEHVEFARYLISQGARVDARSSYGKTALHYACGSYGESTAALVELLVAAGANVNIKSRHGGTPLFHFHTVSESTIDVVTTLLRAGSSLDRQASRYSSFEEYLDHIGDIGEWNELHAEHVGAVRNLAVSVRAAGSWKAHCRLPHKQILRLRSLVARGRTRERLATTRAIRFIVRQGDNGIVWNILSFWRATD